jgi:hypothetical protein
VPWGISTFAQYLKNAKCGEAERKKEKKFGENSLKIHQNKSKRRRRKISSAFLLILSYFTVFSVAICPQGLKA